MNDAGVPKSRIESLPVSSAQTKALLSNTATKTNKPMLPWLGLQTARSLRALLIFLSLISFAFLCTS
jgi:hypothetical protein